MPPASYTETFVLNRQLAYANYAPAEEAWYDTSMLAFTALQNWAFPFGPITIAGFLLTAIGIFKWAYEAPDANAPKH